MLFRTLVRSEETAKSISAAGVSEVSEAAWFTAAWVSELLGKGMLLLSEWQFEVAVVIPIGESSGQALIKKDDNLFFCRRGSRAL